MASFMIFRQKMSYFLRCFHTFLYGGNGVKNYDRVLNFATYILQNNATIRQTAKVFNYSKSTVHNDIHKKLKKINYPLFEKIQKILDKNFLEKHIRGGQSTKQKYLKIKNN